MKKVFILIFASIALLGCSKKASKEWVALSEVADGEIAVEAGYLSSGETFSAVNNLPVIDKKIIRSGSITVQSENVQKSRKELDSILNRTKSYIQDEKFYNYDYREGMEITVRVPNRNFDSLISLISDNGIGIIRSKNISSSDVTEDYYDTEIRLKNKELYLGKYRDFLAQAKTVKDMLEVQEKIRNMEEEIESAKGKLRFIDDRVNFSTLNIEIYKEKPAISGTSEIGFFNRLWASIVSGWNLITDIFFVLLSVWSILLIGGIIFWVIFKIKRNNNS
ncbi:MAG: DUF4349 domain-containing protein [Prevotellaceae bacterium]|jgi:hypothetical protein|nr:DUF4349 domain-containing protein [Prevotellaceae bacterium]